MQTLPRSTMTKKVTRDEQFLIKLYELSSKLGTPHEPIDRYEVGRAIGQNDKGTYVISRDLAQANFIKKSEEDMVYLTDNGLRLVESLLVRG